MLKARKASFWRSRFEILADDRTVATWDSSWWKSGGSFDLDGRRHEVRGNLRGNRFDLVDPAGTVLASADRVGRKQWTVDAAGQTYHFRRASMWSSEQELLAAGVRVGAVKRTSSWTGAVAADLPGLPLAVQIFVVGVVISMWDSQSATSTAGI